MVARLRSTTKINLKFVVAVVWSQLCLHAVFSRKMKIP